jgi:hypothetical protein
VREGNSLPRLALRDRRIFAADRRFRGTADTKASSVRAEDRTRLSLEAVRSDRNAARTGAQCRDVHRDGGVQRSRRNRWDEFDDKR